MKFDSEARELKNISKEYNTIEMNTKALYDINLKFRKNEFVSILIPGPIVVDK